MMSRQFHTRLVPQASLRAVAALLAAASFCTSAHAAIVDANPSNYQNLVSGLAAGDTLRLASGTYATGLSLTGKAGTASQPIIISGPDDQSAIFTARDCCNTVQLDGTSYLQVKNLTLDGGGRDGPFGVDSRGNSHHITIENLKIVGHNGSQQTVGISTKGPAWNWIIRRNTIIGAGTGLYLGNSDGSQPFVAGIIEYNVVLDTIGYNMEIKHQLARPTGVGLPTGTSATIIRHNVFSKRSTTVGSDGARPNVLLGHLPLTGTGANDQYEVYGNFFYQNPTEALFQAEGNLVVHDNLFVNSAGDAVNIQPHNDKPRSVVVYNNTVVATGSGLRISGGDAAYTQRLIANASFAGSAISGPNQANNVTGTYASAADSLNAPYAAIGSLDLYPKTGRLGGTAVDLSAFSAFTDGAKDFNGATRTGVHRGAYEGEGANAGWRLALSIKPSAPASSATLTADPTQVALQGSSTLQWSVANATSCTASDGWSGSKPSTGSETVGPIAADTTYSMTCSTPSGTVSKSVRVQVVTAAATPTVTMSASPGNVAAGGTSIISWTSTDANACSASGGWTGTKPANGSETVGPLQSATSFQLTCLGAGGNANATVQVTVGGSSSPPPTTPPPTTPPPTTPPVTTPPPTTGETKSGGGGGSLDAWMIVCLALVACIQLRRPTTKACRARSSPAR